MQMLGYPPTRFQLLVFLILHCKFSIDKDSNEVLNSTVGWVMLETDINFIAQHALH